MNLQRMQKLAGIKLTEGIENVPAIGNKKLDNKDLPMMLRHQATPFLPEPKTDKDQKQELFISKKQAFEATMDEKAPPGMEDWVKKNKKHFTDEYGEERGKNILYATAWKRHEGK